LLAEDLPPCDPKIYEEGEVVFVTHTLFATDVEAWVKKLAEASGQPVDWHYVAGRVVIKALGDLSKVKQAIQALMPEHDAAFEKNLRLYTDLERPASRPEWWAELSTQ